jgi:hypothetical protein
VWDPTKRATIYNPLVNFEDWDKASGLSRRVRDVLFAAETPCWIEALCLTCSLSDDQSLELSGIIRDVLLGDVGIDVMRDTVAGKLKTETEITDYIAGRMCGELFAPAMPELARRK